MSAADFHCEVAPNGQIAVPPEIASQIPPGEQVRVVIQWGNAHEDCDWRAAARSRFEAAYSDDDSIYDSLIHEPPTR
jgi:hypothetical protein